MTFIPTGVEAFFSLSLIRFPKLSNELVATALTFAASVHVLAGNTLAWLSGWLWHGWDCGLWLSGGLMLDRGEALTISPLGHDDMVSGVSCWVVASLAVFVVGPALADWLVHSFPF